ncbi:MAG: mdh [Parachlamydiales bacterium]|nr:mdh [Parachlamydiales bacterium]
MRPLKKVVITGGAGQVAYSLLFLIARGDLFGPDQPIALHLHDLPEMQKCLEGVAMELEDCAFPLLKEIKIGSDVQELFGGVHFAFLIGSKPRGPGMERKDLLLENGKIFIEQGQALNRFASPDVRVLVVGNPCNANCLIALKNAPDLNPRQFFALTRLDQNRAVYQLAAYAKADVAEVENVTIWGNHSTTQVPDFLNAKIHGRAACQVVKDRQWLENDFFTKVQKRGAEVITCRGKSSAASAAKAALDAMQSVVKPTEAGHWFSMGVYSRGNPYGIDEDLVFSFPCRSRGLGDIEIVPNLGLDPFLKEKLAISQKELMEERTLIAHLLKG